MFETKSKYSSASHPQIDGLTEVVNCNVADLLRCLVEEKLENWDLILSHVEFAYNNSVSRSTGKSPFEIVHGFSFDQPINFLSLPTDYRSSDYAQVFLNIFIICMMRLGEKLF